MSLAPTRFAALLLPVASLSLLVSGVVGDRGSATFAGEQNAVLGGDIAPARAVLDPHPTFNGIAVDSQNHIVMMTDSNRKSLLVYDRNPNHAEAGITIPKHQVIGPATNAGFVTGALLDPEHREMFAVNNDIEDTMLVMPYDAEGNARPARLLAVPHQAWGVALGRSADEIAVSVETPNAIVVYRRAAEGVEAPRRVIQGPHTGMADPHGIFWDERHREIAVANHGNFRGLAKDVGFGCAPSLSEEGVEAGQFQAPSITVYSASAQGDVKPLRMIQGLRTRLDWPMGLAVDPAHNEIAVSNNGDNSILIFSRTARGDAAPVRIIGGPRTGINRPMGLALDATNDEIWVANFEGHTAVAFARSSSGNVPPTRVIRSGPPGAPSTGFGNPMAVGYDSKREQILVPN